MRGRKFIINRGTLMMGLVELHMDLTKDHKTTKGGGWWHVNQESKKFWLYGSSVDFGRAKKEDIEHALQTGRLSMRYKDYQFYHCYTDSLEEAMKEGVLLDRKKPAKTPEND